MYSYDIVVVGGGPGGNAAAIRAAQLEKNVAIVEAGHVGGTCLNRGCIPSQTLLAYTKFIRQIEAAKSWGIETGPATLSFEKMAARKDKVIHALRSDAASMLLREKVAFYNGYANVSENKHITVQSGSTKTLLKAKKIIIATGGIPLIPPISGIDQVDIQTSDTIFNIAEMPKSLVIIGGGVMGVEFASIFSSFNTEVTLVEMSKRIVSSEDPDVSRLLENALKKRRVRIITNNEVVSMYQNDDIKSVIIEAPNGKREQIDCDQVLVAAGRTPNLSAVESLPICMNGQFVHVNSFMETNLVGIYAVGDITGGYQLSHTASVEGITAAEHAAGHSPSIEQKVFPRYIYTSPEIASVGMGEKEVKERGIPYSVQKYPLAANGKAIAMDETEGFIKIIADEKYGKILGGVIAGVNATEILSQSSASMEMERTMAELAKLIQPQPSIGESLFEVANLWPRLHSHMKI